MLLLAGKSVLVPVAWGSCLELGVTLVKEDFEIVH
jgi:hypothetical protein